MRKASRLKEPVHAVSLQNAVRQQHGASYAWVLPCVVVRVYGVQLPGTVHDGTALVRCACAGVTQVAGPHQICCAERRRVTPAPSACRCTDHPFTQASVKYCFYAF